MSSLPIQFPLISKNPSLNTIISILSSSLHRALSNQRPWSEVVDPNSFSRPHSLSEAAYRLFKNTTYFRINYAQLLNGVLALSLFSHPTSLFCLTLLVFGWIALYLFRPPERPLKVLGHQLSKNKVLGLLTLSTAIVMLFTSVASLLLQAGLVGVIVVSIHGAFRCPQALFTDDHQPSSDVASSHFVNAVNCSSGLDAFV